MYKNRPSLIFLIFAFKIKGDNLNRTAQSQTILQLSCPSRKPFQTPTALYSPLPEHSYTDKTENYFDTFFFSKEFFCGGTNLSSNILPKNELLEITAAVFREVSKCEL